MLGSAIATSIISKKEINYIVKIVKPLKESNLLIKAVSKRIKNKPKEQKERCLRMLLGTLSAISLGNLLTGKGTTRAGEDTVRAGPDF